MKRGYYEKRVLFLSLLIFLINECTTSFRVGTNIGLGGNGLSVGTNISLKKLLDKEKIEKNTTSKKLDKKNVDKKNTEIINLNDDKAIKKSDLKIKRIKQERQK